MDPARNDVDLSFDCWAKDGAAEEGSSSSSFPGASASPLGVSSGLSSVFSVGASSVAFSSVGGGASAEPSGSVAGVSAASCLVFLDALPFFLLFFSCST
jgi:hypothetical protein